MTLTDILPTLRLSIPDPLQVDAWPVHTHATVSDVVVAGVSLTRLVELTDTPALLTGDLPRPGMPRARALGGGTDVTVLVFRVTLRVDTQEEKRIALTDCTFDGLSALWSECRLIGRASAARSVRIELIPGDVGGASWPHPVALLPADLREGDLLAVPCAGTVTLHEVRPRPVSARPIEATAVPREIAAGQVRSADRDADADEDHGTGRCLR